MNSYQILLLKGNRKVGYMDVIQSFNNLIQQDKHQETILLLQEFMKNNNLSLLEQGWAFWNISDRYALNREPILEYQNHLKFVEWGKEHLHPNKLHWIVSDATQALTLSLDNKFDEWLDWYEYVCLNFTKNSENRGVRFESHRAMAYTLIKLKYFSFVENPLNRMNKLIGEDENWENIIFSKITYYSLLLEKGFKLNENGVVVEAIRNLKSMMKDILSELENKQEQEKHVLGSWEQLNSSRQSKEAMIILLHNLGCTFSATLHFSESFEVFNLALNAGHELNRFGLAMYLLSNWKLKKDKIEVQNLFVKFRENKYEINDLFIFAPELVEVVR